MMEFTPRPKKPPKITKEQREKFKCMVEEKEKRVSILSKLRKIEWAEKKQRRWGVKEQ